MPTQVPSIEIHDESARIVKGWGTVDVFDKVNERLPIDEFKRIMPVIMKRGGLIMNKHSNQPVGKILNYEFRMKETPEGSKEGVYLTTEVYKDYDSDDEVWEDIKKGKMEGFSFGGRNTLEDVDFSKGVSKKTLKGLEGHEFSYVPSGCNQESTFEEINYIAKESDTDDKNLNKSVSTLDEDDKKAEKFIKNKDVNKSMAEEEEKSKETKKVEEAPIVADSQPSEDPMAMLNAKMDKLIEILSGNTMKAKEEDDEKPKDEKEVEKEGDGEKVKLPESEGDEVSQDKPAEGGKGDESGANFLAKEGIEKIKADITKDVMKSLQVKSADTPRPGAKANDIQKKEEIKAPKNWAEANKMIKKMGFQ